MSRDTLEKVGRILSNYQSTNISAPFRGNPNDTGVAFLQWDVAVRTCLNLII